MQPKVVCSDEEIGVLNVCDDVQMLCLHVCNSNPEAYFTVDLNPVAGEGGEFD